MKHAECKIRIFDLATADSDCNDIVSLWNRSAEETYGFFPLSEKLLRSRIVEAPLFRPQHLHLAFDHERIIGMAHAAVLTEPHYPSGGTIEVVAVDPDYRRQGIGSALLQAAIDGLSHASPEILDGGGSWPFCANYCTLIDGSERSGPHVTDDAYLGLFEKAGFHRDRESLIMRLDLQHTPSTTVPLPANLSFATRERSRETTWLDTAFRGWNLTDHLLVQDRRTLASRSIFARMDHLSEYQGRELYAVFGVNTPEPMRRLGYARINLAELLSKLRERGADEVELHVYADNTPAVNLYKGLGFREVARTVALRR